MPTVLLELLKILALLVPGWLLTFAALAWALPEGASRGVFAAAVWLSIPVTVGLIAIADRTSAGRQILTRLLPAGAPSITAQ